MENNKSQNKVVQTYAEDMAKVIEDDKGGLVKKIIHEEEEHEREKENISPESRKNRFFMIMGLLFVAIGFATLFYFIFTREIPSVPVEQQFTPLIFSDKSVFVDVGGLKKEEVVQTITNAVVKTGVKSGALEGIYLTQNKKIIGLRQFLTLVKSSFIPDNNLGFVKDNFLMGAVNIGTDAKMPEGKFFILIKVRSMIDVFASLRVWEKKMFADLRGFFGFDITPETNYLFTKDFEDGIIENKNARILYEKDGQGERSIALMYIFADDESVIIANSEDTVREVMVRLAASQIKK